MAEELNKENLEGNIEEKSNKEIQPPQSVEKKKEAMDEILNKIRSEEKQKAYADINKWKEDAKKHKEEKEELLKQLKAFQDAGKSDVEKLTASVKELTEKLTLSTQEHEQFKQKYVEELNRKELEIYKIKKIQEAGEEIIPELVVGNSVEEIDLAVEKAKEKFQTIVEKYKKTPTYASTTPTNPPSAIAKQDKQTIKGSDIATMSLEEYKKNRANIKSIARKEAHSIFAGG